MCAGDLLIETFGSACFFNVADQNGFGAGLVHLYSWPSAAFSKIHSRLSSSPSP